jgi:putative addiction module component (TIGR02574 family)
MPIDISLDDLSVAEKVQLLERIWENLCQESGDVRSPEWHKEVLDERRRRLEDGSVTVSSWTDAKERLLNLGK